jgi:hypothetical protein
VNGAEADQSKEAVLESILQEKLKEERKQARIISTLQDYAEGLSV